MPVRFPFLRVLVLVLALAAAAHADDLGAGDPTRVPGRAAEDPALVGMGAQAEPEPFDDHVAIADWNARQKWSYGTDQLMPLTRGMAAAGIPPAARWPLYLFTVPFDLAQLPIAAIGALYGN